MRDWPIGRIASAIRAREVSCEEVTHTFLQRARRADAELACFIELTAGPALARARQTDARLRSDDEAGPLCGVPFAAKDVFVDGGRTPTAGARDMPMRMAARSATVLERVDAAGAVSLGPLNLDPFCYTVTGANPEFGDVGNPWDPARLAGGSSGGAAAAVAAGAVSFAIGTDTGGSARIPASYCGVTAIKPTFGRVPKRGSVPVSYSQDTVSVLGRSAADVALVLECVAGHDLLDPSSIDAPVQAWAAGLDRPARLDGLRIGIDLSTLAASVQPPALEAALHVLTDLGAALVDVDLRALARYDVAATVLTWSEVAAAHTTLFASARARYPPATRMRLDAAQLAHGADHVNALRYRGRALCEFLGGPLSTADVVATPTTAVPPPPRAAIGRDGSRPEVQSSLDALRLTRPFNFLGVPALSLPVGFDAQGLPVGLQLVGRPWEEGRLLACAAAYQALTDWHLREPALPTVPVSENPP